MSGITTKRYTVTKTTHKIELDRDALLGLLRHKYPQMPKDAQVYITVPGGGDWSNTTLDIGPDVDLEVSWTTTEELSQ